jgi:hypothetical protein
VAFEHGSNSFISVDGTTLSSYVDSVSFDRTGETAEVTAFGNDDKAYIAGLFDGAIQISGHWDATQDAAVAGCFDGSTVTVIYGPDGSTAGEVRYSFAAIITNYSPSSSVGDKVSWSASLQKTGTLTRNTF